MLSFSDLYERMDLVSEGKVSPYKKFSPSFGNVTTQLTAGGLSSPPYDTIKFIAIELFGLGIFTANEHESIIRAGGKFSAKKAAFLNLLELKKDEINQRSTEIETAINSNILNYIKGAGVQRGAERFGGRSDTYKDKALAHAMKKGAQSLAADTDSSVAADVLNQVVDAADAAEKNIDDEKVGVGTQKVGTMALINKAVEKLMVNLKANIGDGPDEINIDLDLIEKVEAYIERKITTLKGLRELTLKLSNMPGHQYKLLANYLQFEVTDRIKDIVKKLKPTYNTADKVEDEEKVSDEPYAESTTYHYLSEQIKKDTHTHRSTEVSVSFKDKYKPKTHWQLAELRRYGM